MAAGGTSASAYFHLKNVVSNLKVQGGANLRLAELRHVGLWLEHLEAEVKIADRSLSPDLKSELLAAFKESVEIPEVTRFLTEEQLQVSLSDLWDLCDHESSFQHLSDLIRFIKGSNLDELTRLVSRERHLSQPIVSTINKVKGLEFDHVIVLPSYIGFAEGLQARSPALTLDAAEEARLLYVAMTRAKERLTYFVGDREHAWASASNRRPFTLPNSNNQRVLEGLHEEVSLGWACTKIDRFNDEPDACQNHIERHVRVGDAISVGGVKNMSLLHRNAAGEQRQIGYLAQKFGPGSANSSLVVSAVVRWKPDLVSTGGFDGSIASSVRQRGWGYVVLVSGQLR